MHERRLHNEFCGTISDILLMSLVVKILHLVFSRCLVLEDMILLFSELIFSFGT